MNQIQIRFSGSGGQGLQLAAKILAGVVAANGRHVSLSQSYEPTSRGGLSRADLVISDAVADYPLVTRLDHLVILDQCAVGASAALVDADTRIICDRDRVETPPGTGRIEMLPILEQAKLAGTPRAINVVALGALLARGSLADTDAVLAAVRGSVPERFADMNADAFRRGFGLSENSAERASA